MYETMPPITVLSKVLSVESGEILYHDIVGDPSTSVVRPMGRLYE
jgi:hypothetical protein